MTDSAVEPEAVHARAEALAWRPGDRVGKLLAGPFAGRLLGDMGAEIIKVELPGQPDPDRAGAGPATRGGICGGRSCCATRSASRSTCATSAARSSCSSSSSTRTSSPRTSAGTLEKWNLGFDRLSQVNPKIILCRVSGYGQTGPYAKRAGFASVAEAMGGIRYINGFPDEPPPRMHISLGDSLAGMFAVHGILAALYWRDVLGGKGQVVDVSLLESSFALLESMVPEFDRLEIVRGPGGMHLKGIAPSSIFRSKDGKWIVVAANADNVFRRSVRGDGHAQLADDVRFSTHLARGDHPGRDRGHYRRVGRPA